MSIYLTIKQRKALAKMNYHISDEDGYVYQVSSNLLKEAERFGPKDSLKFVNYLGSRLDKWKTLPLLTAGTAFKRIGHVLTVRR
jgi:uncharacterized protein YxjI